MGILRNKWWLAVLLLCLCPVGMSAHDHDKNPCKYKDRWDYWDDDKGCGGIQAPEGGSAPMYLLGAGLTCLGGMFVRSRFSKTYS